MAVGLEAGSLYEGLEEKEQHTLQSQFALTQEISIKDLAYSFCGLHTIDEAGLSKAALAVIERDGAWPNVSKPASLLPLVGFLTIDCQEGVVSLAEAEPMVKMPKIQGLNWLQRG